MMKKISKITKKQQVRVTKEYKRNIASAVTQASSHSNLIHVRNKTISRISTIQKSDKWIQWLAGFIDGDGSILVYKDHVSIEATTGLEDEGVLTEIKKAFGGSIKPRSNAKALRWRSRKKDVVIKMLNCLNGFLRNTIRVEQFSKACAFYDLSLKTKKAFGERLSPDSAYLAGFFDADGTISLSCFSPKSKKVCLGPTLLLPDKATWNRNNNIPGDFGKVQRLIYSRGHNQCVIKCTNKHRENLEFLCKEYNLGKCFYEKPNTSFEEKNYGKWHWIITQDEIYDFLNYIKLNPVRGKKKKRRLHLLPKYLKLKQMGAHLADENSIQFKEWKKFCYAWYNIKNSQLKI